MYIPAAFRVDGFDETSAFIEEHSFATLVTFDGEAAFATHLPLLFNNKSGELGALSGHVARGNEQWKHLQKAAENRGEVLAIFQGPHAYISPSWYETDLAVPTWNYIAVHAYGAPRILDDEALDAQLRAMIEKYESAFPSPWPGDLPQDFWTKLRGAIVGFEIEITRLEGKWKLGQNRSQSDQENVIATLQKALSDDERAIAN
ncbi:MAG TPA: FMN-binding negative transcriptional regulator, partial [Abditibacteriaceae bacterium]